MTFKIPFTFSSVEILRRRSKFFLRFVRSKEGKLEDYLKDSGEKIDRINYLAICYRNFIEDSLEGDTQASFQLNRAAQDRIKDLEEQARLIQENADARTTAINDELKADETSGRRIVSLEIEKDKIEENTKAQLESIEKLKKASEEKSWEKGG